MTAAAHLAQTIRDEVKGRRFYQSRAAALDALAELERLAADAERWKERARYLLTTDLAEWEPEVIKWLAA